MMRHHLGLPLLKSIILLSRCNSLHDTLYEKERYQESNIAVPHTGEAFSEENKEDTQKKETLNKMCLKLSHHLTMV
jgi:hypothetical protein